MEAGRRFGVRGSAFGLAWLGAGAGRPVGGIALRSVLWVSCLLAGCGGDAQVELAAGDALLAVADQMEVTVSEYHGEVSQFDDSRESAAVSAFIRRVQDDAGDTAALDAHAVDFTAALQKIRADREAEWGRRAAAMDNVAVLREIARGVQKLAIESLSLEDEVRRYLSGWIDARREAKGEVRSEK